MHCFETYMQRALDLAVSGWGGVSPNPMVGAVVVRGGKVVGEGWHARFGGAHAEINALNAAGDAAKRGDLIVNLEPCAHIGKNPPCVSTILRSGIRRVVYGMRDPNPLVNGRGIRWLAENGIEVVGPVMEKECRSLNRIFLHWMKTGRPYVISKVATTLDGKIATAAGDSRWITGKKCRQRMHYWRRGVDAVLVGAETARRDNPLLSARSVGCRRQPRPVIVTGSGELSGQLKIWKRSPLVFCGSAKRLPQIEKLGGEAVILPKDNVWDYILKTLAGHGMTSVLIEGGASIHRQLIGAGIASYMIATISAKFCGSDGLQWAPPLGLKEIGDLPRIMAEKKLISGDDIVIEGEVRY